MWGERTETLEGRVLENKGEKIKHRIREEGGTWGHGGKVKKLRGSGAPQRKSENEQTWNQRTEETDTGGRNLGNSGAA
jgi:hypothetical protein